MFSFFHTNPTQIVTLYLYATHVTCQKQLSFTSAFTKLMPGMKIFSLKYKRLVLGKGEYLKVHTDFKSADTSLGAFTLLGY